MNDYPLTTAEVRKHFELSGNPEQFDTWLETTIADKVVDIAMGLIDWDVMHGTETATLRDIERHDTAAWIMEQVGR